MKRVLMVAYHFPPLAGSSGIQRTLRFAQHLPQFGWQPLVLSVRTFAYERTSTDLEDVLPADTVIRRAFALDSARHLALFGRHFASTARPDRWVSWKFDGVRQGLNMIRTFCPDALWSTYPIATAHMIGAELNRRSGIPWVADFRDPMAQPGYPEDALTWQRFESIEMHAVAQAGFSMFTTPSAAQDYRARYPDAAVRIIVLENGYDEESFDGLSPPAASGALNPGMITLLHSGIIYPSERDPTQLFLALGNMKRAGRVSAASFRLRLRAPVHDEILHRLSEQHGVTDLVEVLPAIGYRSALQEMLDADALLVMQASNCNAQVPAKIYEYMRAARPIVCLTDVRGDTAAVLRRAGIEALAALDAPDQIEALLMRIVEGNAQGLLPVSTRVADASRQRRTAELAAYLDRLTADKGAAHAR
jgi:glycosyltransferase involved in cell wall biosynthesis